MSLTEPGSTNSFAVDRWIQAQAPPTSCRFEVDVDEAAVHAFAELSGDHNPLHVDPGYAAGTELGQPAAHGALLVGYVSRVLGMHIPGRRSLVLSMRVRFPRPTLYPARLVVEGKLADYDPGAGRGRVLIGIEDARRGWPVLEADVSFMLHGTRPGRPAATPGSDPSIREPGPRTGQLLVTGAAGGIASGLVPALSELHPLVCVVRRAPASPGPATYVQVDLEDGPALEDLLEEHHPGDFYGILHLSSPPVRRSFLSDDAEGCRRHLYHAVELPARLVRWARQPGSSVRRIILFGTQWGSRSPRPNQGAYSVAKAAMEHATRLLAYDLSAMGATINVVAPSPIPVGMNSGLSDRALAAAAGAMPSGRLVQCPDLVAIVRFLLSEPAAMINGSVVSVDGGLLGG